MCPVLRMAITLRWVIVVRSLFLWARNDAHTNNVIPRSVATWESNAESDEIDRPSDRKTERPSEVAINADNIIPLVPLVSGSQGLGDGGW